MASVVSWDLARAGLRLVAYGGGCSPIERTAVTGCFHSSARRVLAATPPASGREEHERHERPLERQLAMQRVADDPVDHLHVDPVDEERGLPELAQRAEVARPSAAAPTDTRARCRRAARRRG